MNGIKPTLLAEYEKEIIRQSGSPVMYKKGSIIFRPGDAADKVYLIEQGWVKIFRLTMEGRQVTVGSIRHPGELMGLAEVLYRGERTCHAGAISEVTLIAVRKDDFHEMLLGEPQLAIKIAKLLAARMREAESSIHELVSRNVPGRLASILLRMAQRCGEPTDNGIRINLNLTHEELAGMIGASRQTVTSLISQLREEKSISVKGRQIRIIDPKKLSGWTV
ncbi:MAG: Crp/Fnr family transcriptional regulator [Bacillota bacterium]|jgi:CRP-like cAMP-binding protein